MNYIYDTCKCEKSKGCSIKHILNEKGKYECILCGREKKKNKQKKLAAITLYNYMFKAIQDKYNELADIGLLQFYSLKQIAEMCNEFANISKVINNLCDGELNIEDPIPPEINDFIASAYSLGNYVLDLEEISIYIKDYNKKRHVIYGVDFNNNILVYDKLLESFIVLS